MAQLQAPAGRQANAGEARGTHPMTLGNWFVSFGPPACVDLSSL